MIFESLEEVLRTNSCRIAGKHYAIFLRLGISISLEKKTLKFAFSPIYKVLISSVNYTHYAYEIINIG